MRADMHMITGKVIYLVQICMQANAGAGGCRNISSMISKIHFLNGQFPYSLWQLHDVMYLIK